MMIGELSFTATFDQSNQHDQSLVSFQPAGATKILNSNKLQEERHESTSTTETSFSVPVKTTAEKQFINTNSGQVKWKVLDIIFYYAF